MNLHIPQMTVALLTARHSDGTINIPGSVELALAIRDEVQSTCPGFPIGFLVAGSTGQGGQIVTSDKLAFLREMREALPDAHLMFNVSTTDTAESVNLAELGEEWGASSLLISAPPYSRPPSEGLEIHFTYTAEATSLPVVLYEIDRTAVSIPRDLVVRLAEAVANIVAIKEASGDTEDRIPWIIKNVPDDFAVLSGNDNQTFDINFMGGKGDVGVNTNIPKVAAMKAQMYLALSRGDIDEAMRIAQSFMPLHDALFPGHGISNPISPMDAVNQCGFNIGDPRLPLPSLKMIDEARGKDFRRANRVALRELGIDCS